jgi:energy-coupling factor transport system substrate-specific component
MRQLTPFQISFLALCAGLNAGIGFLVHLINAPIYLDSAGSVLAAVLIGPLWGAVVAMLGILLLGVLTSPTLFGYVFTAIIISLSAYWFQRFGYLRTWFATILFGMVLGIIAALVSAPVTIYLFGGVTFVGADAVTLFFRALGQTLWLSVLQGGLITDMADKTLLSVICFLVVRNIPLRSKQRLSSNA